MRQPLFILTALILLSCEKQKEQIEKFIFDNKQITDRTTHKYDFYPNGKIKTDYAMSFYIMAGVLFDSIASIKQYSYNLKGQIESIFDPTDSTKQLKLYDELDSLVAELTINKYGDTTNLVLTDFNESRRLETRRILSPKFPENLDDMKNMDPRNYDTMFFQLETFYLSNRAVKTISKDINGDIETETEFIYDGDKQTKTLTYSFLGDTRYLSGTTNYNYNEFKNPDFVTIGTKNDTIAYMQTVFQDDMRIQIYYTGQFDSHDISYYNKKNQLIGTVTLNHTERVKYVYKYTYDKKGHVIEELSYKERLSNAR